LSRQLLKLSNIKLSDSEDSTIPNMEWSEWRTSENCDGSVTGMFRERRRCFPDKFGEECATNIECVEPGEHNYVLPFIKKVKVIP